MKTVILSIIFLVVAGMVYVRLAPVDVARWHGLDAQTVAGDQPFAGGHIAVRQITEAPTDVLAALDQIAQATPRTKMIAGSLDAGMLTYQTRSLIWGFPDYTTVAVQGDLLVIHARLRFGGSDMGVNRARVLDWIAALGPLTRPL
jgi:uncharacterized protein (DUF1499 family)